MNKETEKSFDTVAFFREIKDKLSAKMKGMTLIQKKEFMRQLKSGEIKIG